MTHLPRTYLSRAIYVGLFFTILLVLFVWSLRAFPGFQAPANVSVIDGQWAKAFESHFDKEFPVKRLGTNVWAAVDFLLFGEGRPGVIVGRDGWLYSDEEFISIANGETNVQDNWALIRGVQRELEARDIRLVLAILPAKARLYPEHLHKRIPSNTVAPLYRQFHAQARDAGLNAPDLLTPLQQAKQQGTQVFLRTDTHWTPSGAEVVAQQLAKRIRGGQLLREPPRLYVTQPGTAKPHQGDLLNFLPLDPLFSHLLPEPDQLQLRSTEPLADGNADQDLFGDTQVPVVLVGTSYSADPRWNFLGALRQSLQSDVVNFAEDGRGPLLPMLSFLQTASLEQAPPKVVIWEFPERYLPVANDLSGFDPDWVAQLKAAAASDPRVAHRTPPIQPIRESN
jgi:alginate O-acetyltransferase complex protein AlgJ